MRRLKRISFLLLQVRKNRESVDENKERAIHYLEIALPRGILYERFEMRPFPSYDHKFELSKFLNGAMFGISVRNAVDIVGFKSIQEMFELGSVPISRDTFDAFLRANTRGI